MPYRILRAKPEGFWLRIATSVGAIMWAAASFRIGEDDLSNPDVYRVVLTILSLDAWAILGAVLGAFQLVAAMSLYRWPSIITAALMSGFWSCFGYYIHASDPNALGYIFYAFLALLNATTVTIVLIRQPVYER